MSWLYSQELVEEYSEGISWDGEQCALWNGTHTQPASWLPVKTTKQFRLSRSGMMYKPLTDDLGADVLTSFLEAFPVKTSVLPERAQESTGNDQECGSTWRGSFAKYDPDSFSWRTRQRSLLEGWESYSETWPKSGTMRSGECWERTTLEHRTEGNESGYWPTPNSRDWKDSGPTQGNRKSPNLGTVVQMYLTPTTCGNYNRKGASKTSGDGLATKVGGKLNPTWVEWLMNWPIGWTDIKTNCFYETEYWKAASTTQIQSGGVQEMWFNREAGAPPHRQKPDEQQSGQCRDSFFQVSPQGTPKTQASEMQNLPCGISAEESEKSEALRFFKMQQGERKEISRIAVGVNKHADRLKCLGNGQVPAVAATAFRILRERISE